MYHDSEMIRNAAGELFSLGEGEVGYIRVMRPDEIRALPTGVSFSEAWGVFSASGETLAVCDSPAAAWAFFADHELIPVSLH